MYGDFLSLLFLASSHSGGGGGGFPYSVQHMAAQVEVTSGSTSSSRTSQYTRIRSMRSLSMSTSSNYGGVQ